MKPVLVVLAAACLSACEGGGDDTGNGSGCVANAYQGCSGGDIYWFDSCDVAGSIVRECTSNESCVEDGDSASCEADCTPNDHQDCYNGDVHWFDSCGDVAALVADCTGTETCVDNGATATCVPECTTHSQCGSEEFCYNEECLVAVGREYSVQINSLTVGTLDPSGQYWDVGGGAPDLFVRLGVVGDYYYTSDGLDSFSMTWNQHANFILTGANPFQFDVYEADVTTDDWYAGWSYPAGTAGVVSMARSNGQQQTVQDPSGTIVLKYTVFYPKLQ